MLLLWSGKCYKSMHGPCNCFFFVLCVISVCLSVCVSVAYAWLEILNTSGTLLWSDGKKMDYFFLPTFKMCVAYMNNY